MIRVVVELEKSPVVFVVESKEDKNREKLPLLQKSVVLNEAPEENYYHQLAIAKSSVDQVALRSRLREHVDDLLESTFGRKKKAQAQAPVPSSSSRKKNRRNIPMDRSRPLDEAQSSSSSSQTVEAVNELRKSQSSSDPAFLRVSGSSQGDSVQLRSSSEALGEHQSEITIYMGNPIVESFKGIVHLYRAFTPPYDEEGLPTNPDASWIPRSPSSLPDKRSNMILILGIPSHIPPSEFCQWIIRFESLRSLRIVTDKRSSSRYSVIVQFSDQINADAFYLAANGTQFNTLEPDVCLAYFVASVEMIEPADSQIFKFANEKELPSCPVCLERLDSSESGVITSFCNHDFHVSCLAQCNSESSCPVCRHTLTQACQDNVCFECSARENLWICLLCGHIGCSRYQNEHAEQHFKETQHTYSLEIDTQRVWDYASDSYVHRLIQNMADGKPVELPGRHQKATIEGKDYGKVEALTIEFNYLLAAQLESQRQYFEEIIESLKKDKERETAELKKTLEKTSAERSQIMGRYEKVASEASSNDSQKRECQAKLTKALEELNHLRQESEFLRQINAQLTEYKSQWDSKIKEVSQKAQQQEESANERMVELESQVHDLMLHIQTLQMINSSSEISEGQVIVVPAPTPPPSSSSSSSSSSSPSRPGVSNKKRSKRK